MLTVNCSSFLRRTVETGKQGAHDGGTCEISMEFEGPPSGIHSQPVAVTRNWRNFPRHGHRRSRLRWTSNHVHCRRTRCGQFTWKQMQCSRILRKVSSRSVLGQLIRQEPQQIACGLLRTYCNCRAYTLQCHYKHLKTCRIAL